MEKKQPQTLGTGQGRKGWENSSVWGQVRPMLSHEEELGDLSRVSTGDSRGQDYGEDTRKDREGARMGRVLAYFLRCRD